MDTSSWGGTWLNTGAGLPLSYTLIHQVGNSFLCLQDNSIYH